MNRISLHKSIVRQYEPVLVHKGPDYAIMKLHELRADTANYYLDVLEMNSLGYDSYGDALMKAGKKKEAIAYTRSLSLNPKNENAKKNLKILQNGVK
jgi:predicted negative regulator of RcsB-dependent stress response